MIIAFLGILDMIAGVLIMFHSSIGLRGSTTLLILAVLLFSKALYSIATALAAGFAFDVLGWIDIAAALLLALLYWGISFEVFFWFGLLIVLKGVYSFVVAFIMN